MSMQAKLYAYLKKGSLPDVLICEDAAEAQQLLDLCRFKAIDAVVLPDFRATWLDDLRPFGEELSQMAEALRHYYGADKKPLVIAPFKSLLFPLPKAKLLRTKPIAFGDRLDLAALKTELLHWGYSFVDLVEVEGEVSFRGDIIDLFAPGTENPYRISLFDDEIEQIKAFEVETQRTVGEEVEAFELHSAPYAFDEAGYERIVAAVEASTSDSFVKDIDSLGFWYLGDDAENFLEGKKSAAVKRLDAMIGEAYTLNTPQVPQSVFESVAVLPEDDRVKALAVTDVKTLLEAHPNKRV
ncbi:MAG: transcription-repair coupling factor, partial [Campylobacterales bacterium]|nr:transcription-repair coupling factor [Campylobacterales bacterium]